MKYIVIDTWNGDGYSSENGVEITKFKTKREALGFAYGRATDNIVELLGMALRLMTMLEVIRCSSCLMMRMQLRFFAT